MRLLVHDFAGHPFQIQLSRELARRGHVVTHAYCASLTTTPQGTLQHQDDDPPTFEIVPIHLARPIQKQAFFTRWRQELKYGHLISDLARTLRPDAILSGNTPLDAQARLLRTAKALDARFVFWAQDLIGIATKRFLRGKIPFAGAWIGQYYESLEKRLLQKSDALVLISEDFRAEVPARLPQDRIHSIPNWAPIEEISLRPRDNAWAKAQGLSERPRFLYSGTLGLKHNPDLLLQLARTFPEADVLVISTGPGAEWLHTQKAQAPNLHLLPFQPFEQLPDVLGAADVLVAILEKDAGIFSVPSKVLSYLCAGRALLLAVPPMNLAARIVRQEQAGLVVPPDDTAGFLTSARHLLDQPAARTTMGHHARTYAKTHFDITRIADQFEAALIPN